MRLHEFCVRHRQVLLLKVLNLLLLFLFFSFVLLLGFKPLLQEQDVLAIIPSTASFVNSISYLNAAHGQKLDLLGCIAGVVKRRNVSRSEFHAREIEGPYDRIRSIGVFDVGLDAHIFYLVNEVLGQRSLNSLAVFVSRFIISLHGANEEPRNQIVTRNHNPVIIVVAVFVFVVVVVVVVVICYSIDLLHKLRSINQHWKRRTWQRNHEHRHLLHDHWIMRHLKKKLKYSLKRIRKGFKYKRTWQTCVRTHIQDNTNKMPCPEIFWLLLIFFFWIWSLNMSCSESDKSSAFSMCLASMSQVLI